MLQPQRLTLVLLAATVATTAPATARAGDGDWILRVTPGFVAPTADATQQSVGFADFTDPRFPPLGTIDYSRTDLISAKSDLGLELELERMLTDSIGIAAGFGYARLVSETSLSGEATHIPYVGEPRTLAPERSRSGPVAGGGTGTSHQFTLTAGPRFHVVRGEKIDVYLGPLVGVSASEARFVHGDMRLLLGWVSRTPLEGDGGVDTRLEPALGGLLGIDLPLGNGWQASAMTRYLWTGGFNPSLIQLGLGYRF